MTFHHRPNRSSRRVRSVAEFGRDAGQLSVSLIQTSESLAGHPHRKLIENTISFWRRGAARQSDKVCFSCQAAFGAGRAVPCAFLVAVGSSNATSAAIGGLCTACFAKTDAEIDQAATRMLRRITGPRGHWIDPRPTQKAGMDQ